jgi:DNA-binding winged helix-turn-helix (wHTH) protein/TolB-like protein
MGFEESTNSNLKLASVNDNRYVFDDFEVDTVNRTCARAGELLPITGKVFDILAVFVENPGRLLSKDELLDRVWPNEFVEEGNLARNVSTLRKALGDNGKDHKYIVTVPGHGYRFIADVSTVEPSPLVALSGNNAVSETDDTDPIDGGRPLVRSRKLLWTGAALVLLFTAAWFGKDRLFSPSPTVKTIAVLPLKGIDPNDNYLGFGIADAVIRRLSSSGQVTVRPASAVLHYINQETDTLAAAHELGADAILEGNVQRFGETLRVSVNLLRTADGISIWSERFDRPAKDFFRLQDEVAEQVAEKLKIRLGSSILAGTNDKYPTDQRAYEFYLKGMFGLDTKGFDKDSLPLMLNTIDLFQQAIILDPNYAMAHGQLAYSYAWMAMFVQPDEPKWADLARQEIALAEKLDPNVAEAHLANGLLCWSSYGGYKTEDAIKEFRLAKQLNPGYNGADLIALYGHAGLDEQATKELNRELTSDPTSQALNGLVGILPYLRGDFDAWYALHPEHPIEDRPLAQWYLLHKGDLDLAQKLIDDRIKQTPEDYHLLTLKPLLATLKGNNAEADAQLKTAFTKIPHNHESYHHQTYFIACIKAVEGNSTEAVKWLRETANSGYPNYLLFAKDPFLDRIRQSPEFVQFLAEQKAQWEHFEQEFPVE